MRLVAHHAIALHQTGRIVKYFYIQKKLMIRMLA